MKLLAFTVGLLAPLVLAMALTGGSEDSPLAALDHLQAQSAEPLAAPAAEVVAIPAAVKKADPGPVAERLVNPVDPEGAEAVWQDWTARHNITASAMAIGLDGEILLSTGSHRSADAPYPVASLSKAVTAMCLNTLLIETGLNWSTTLGDLAPALDGLNMRPHPGVHGLSLGELATHSSGFPKNINRADTAGEGRNLYTQQHFAREALTNPDRQPEIGKYIYSNVNYAVLGQVIIALGGGSYSDICADRVMSPAGATSALVGGRMWATAGFGGWSASAEDYARFVMHWLGPDRPWISRPESYPYNAKKGSGLGVFHDRQRKTHSVSHNGLWESKEPKRRHGAFFLITETGATFAANWQGNVDRSAYRELRDLLGPHLR